MDKAIREQPDSSKLGNERKTFLFMSSYGGKKWLVPRLPQYTPEHKAYVEPCAGVPRVLLTKARACVEVINDICSGIANFYRVLRDPKKFEKFRTLACLPPYAEEEYRWCKAHWHELEDDALRAWAWFVQARQARNGLPGSSWSREKTVVSRRMLKNVSRWLSSIECLEDVHARLQGVQIENRDFRSVIEAHDDQETWFFIDPPYVLSTRSSGRYPHDMVDDDHYDLVDLLLDLKGMTLLCGRPNDIYIPLEIHGWRRDDFSIPIWASPQRNRKPIMTESLWLSPSLQKALNRNRQGSKTIT